MGDDEVSQGNTSSGAETKVRVLRPSSGGNTGLANRSPRRGLWYHNGERASTPPRIFGGTGGPGGRNYRRFGGVPGYAHGAFPHERCAPPRRGAEPARRGFASPLRGDRAGAHLRRIGSEYDVFSRVLKSDPTSGSSPSQLLSEKNTGVQP